MASVLVGRTIQNLSFEEKRAIVRDTVDKVIGTQQELLVSGEIPVNFPHVEYKTNYRYGGVAKRGEVHAL